MIYCNEIDWVRNESSYFDWYYKNYPLKENNVILPIPMWKLQAFYAKDMSDRNLTPLDEYLHCYHHLFSYFLGRLTNAINFRGQNFWERTVSNLPGAISKTFTQVTDSISNPFGMPLWVYGAGIITILILLNKK